VSPARGRSHEDRWFDLAINPIPGEADLTVGALVIACEITDHMRAVAALRTSEQRFRSIAEATTNSLYRVDATGTALVEVYGAVISPHSRDAAPSTTWSEDYVHPDDRVGNMAAWKRAMTTGTPYRNELRARRADGSWGWILSHAVPLRDEQGRVAEWIGSATDINERKCAQEALEADVDSLLRLQRQQKVLVSELQHRTRNLLAVVRAIASQTLVQDDDDHKLESFLERLSSLGRVQGLLSRAEGERVKLIDIVDAEIRACGDSFGSRLEIHGPDVNLSSYQVQTIALALHELLTNALKYGALAQPSGRLSLTWETWRGANGQPRLVLAWRESGVTIPPDAPARRGYGRELIEEALRFSLRAETQFVFHSDGVWCRIEMPLETAAYTALDPPRP
jgi:two-component system CheB/CheR fusion protein